MPLKRTIEKARRDKREGKSASTQAGEFVHEEIDKIRHGEQGALDQTSDRHRPFGGAARWRRCRRRSAAKSLIARARAPNMPTKPARAGARPSGVRACRAP